MFYGNTCMTYLDIGRVSLGPKISNKNNNNRLFGVLFWIFPSVKRKKKNQKKEKWIDYEIGVSEVKCSLFSAFKIIKLLTIQRRKSRAWYLSEDLLPHMTSIHIIDGCRQNEKLRAYSYLIEERTMVPLFLYF